MKKNWSVVPDFDKRYEFAELVKEYGANFEYDDFFIPAVYEDKDEVERRIKGYLALGRDTSKDTLHGTFLDTVISSDDSVIRDHSMELMRFSMRTAQRLGVKGVVFHTGLIKGLDTASYINTWLTRQTEFWRQLAGEFPDLDIYMENTTESTPDYILRLKNNLKDVGNFALCLDWAHASLQPAPFEEWVDKMGPYVKHMHVNDNDGIADIHAVPGEGIMDWKKFDEMTKKYLPDVSFLIELNGLERQKKALKFLTSF